MCFSGAFLGPIVASMFSLCFISFLFQTFISSVHWGQPWARQPTFPSLWCCLHIAAPFEGSWVFRLTLVSESFQTRSYFRILCCVERVIQYVYCLSFCIIGRNIFSCLWPSMISFYSGRPEWTCWFVGHFQTCSARFSYLWTLWSLSGKSLWCSHSCRQTAFYPTKINKTKYSYVML